jgi:hypothetical protein
MTDYFVFVGANNLRRRSMAIHGPPVFVQQQQQPEFLLKKLRPTPTIQEKKEETPPSVSFPKLRPTSPNSPTPQQSQPQSLQQSQQPQVSWLSASAKVATTSPKGNEANDMQDKISIING